MHYWGAEDFRWDRLDDAIRFLDTNLVRWGRINVRQSKEKFGEARVYCDMGFSSGIYWFLYPGRVYYRGYKWAKRIPGWAYFTPFWVCKAINKILVPYQCWVYRKTYARAVRKWPDLAKEILGAADYDKLLEGLMPEGYYFKCRYCKKRSAWLSHVRNYYICRDCYRRRDE
jgi:hypothetical protein